MAVVARVGVGSVSCCVVHLIRRCVDVHGVKSCLATVDREDSQVSPLLPTKVMHLDPSFCNIIRYGPSSGIVVVSPLAWASSNSCHRTLGVRMHSVEYVVASNKSKFVPLQSN